MDILLNGIHKLCVLFGGVGVVHAQVADAAELFCGPEVYNQSLAVADMQIAVGFRRKTGVHLHPSEPAARGNILLNKLVDEVLALRPLLGDRFNLVRHKRPPPFTMGLFYTRNPILASIS